MRRKPVGVLVAVVLGLMASGCARPPAEVPPAAVATAAADKPAAQPDAAQPLEELRRTLTATDDSRVRVLTIDAIADLGPKAAPVLDELVKTTTDPDERVRWHAARAIGLIGSDAAAAMPTLVALLGDTDPIVVAQAAAAIGSIRADDDRPTIPQKDASLYASATEPLIKTTTHTDARARRAAVRALRVLSPEPAVLAPLLSKQLADSDPSVILPALHTLADMDDEAVPVLIEALKDPKGRYWATLALAEVGPEAAPASAALATLITEGEVEEKLQAILALAAIGEPAASAAPVIMKTLESKDASLRYAAAFALGRLRAAEADQVLEAAAADSDSFLASIASWARARLHPDDAALRADAVTKMRAGLTSDEAKVRAASASGLSDLVESLKPDERNELANAFVGLLTDADPNVGTRGGAALIRMGSDAVPTLQSKLADPAVRHLVLEILAAIGPAAKPAIGDLVAALSDTDEYCRGEAATALAAIGPEAATAVPDLQKALTDPSTPPGVRYAAAYALGRIGQAAKPALEALRGLTESEDEILATVAVWAALKIEPGDASLFESAMPRLRKALRSDQELARLEAAVALGDIGPAAATAIPLLEMVKEDDPAKRVRAAAGEALTKIRGR